MKTIGLFGLLCLLSIVACSRIAGALSTVAPGPVRPVVMPAPAAMAGSGELPAGLSEYVFLHQTRDESVPVQTLAGMATCSE